MKPTAEYAPELINQIIKLIAPLPNLEAHLLQRVAEDVKNLKQIRDDHAAMPSPAAVRDRAEALALSLRNAVAKVRALHETSRRFIFLDRPPAQGGVHFDSFLRDIERTANLAKGFAGQVSVGQPHHSGKQPWDAVGYFAKLYASLTMRDFSQPARKRGEKSRVEMVAALLYEIVTGVQGKNLAHHKIHDDRLHDRIEPALVLRMPIQS